MWKLSIKKALAKFIKNSQALWNLWEWIYYRLTEVSTISICSFEGKITIYSGWYFSNVTSFNLSAWKFHTLSTINFNQAMKKCLLFDNLKKVLLPLQTKKIFTKVCNKLTTKNSTWQAWIASRPAMRTVILTELWPEADQASQNLRKINFVKSCGVIKNFAKSEIKFKVFC